MGGGNSLIINELEQKPSDFTESFTENLIEKSGGIKGVNVIKGINGFDAAAFLFSGKLQTNNKQSLTNLNVTVQKMKKQTKKKAFMLSLAMAVAMSLPMTMNAQSDGFFRSGANDNYDNRDGEQTMTTQNFGESAPLGSGLLIMLGAGAGYVLLKKKEEKI